MSTDQSVCLGCCLHPNFIFNPYPPLYAEWPYYYGKMIDTPRKECLTLEEREILKILGEAFSKFTNLLNSSDADKAEFIDAIHRAQQIIALRVARRVDSDVWYQPE
jgi:hypothetical protein